MRVSGCVYNGSEDDLVGFDATRVAGRPRALVEALASDQDAIEHAERAPAKVLDGA